jgi:hypothetical protein
MSRIAATRGDPASLLGVLSAGDPGEEGRRLLAHVRGLPRLEQEDDQTQVPNSSAGRASR